MPSNNNVDGGGGANHNQLGWASFGILMIVMAVSKIFSCMYFTSMAICMNKTVQTSQRATLNGLAMVLGSIAKGLGPLFAGFLVAVCYSNRWFPARDGSALIFVTIGLLGAAILVQLRGLKPVNR